MNETVLRSLLNRMCGTFDDFSLFFSIKIQPDDILLILLKLQIFYVWFCEIILIL